MIRLALLLAVAGLALTACGAGAHRASAPATKPAATKGRVCKNQAAALRKIGRDIAALRAAAKLPTTNRLLGNHAINVATDSFLNHVALAPISNLRRNRLIDHAMSAIGTKCEQCFQALEAGRPIPAIRAGQIGCSG